MNFPILPDQASTFAHEVDNVGLVLTTLTIVFTALVFTLLLVLSIRYRRGSKADRTRALHHNLPLEIFWSAIPLVLGLTVFYMAVQPYAHVYNPPPNAEEIFVIGKQWMWHLQHSANGIRENNELHIPTGRPFKLTLISQDVIHGFYIPDFRVKRDVMPGKYNTCWFEATKPGKYHLFCTEFCGTNHSQMGGWVYVMSPADYERWVATGGDRMVTRLRTPEEDGYSLYTEYACGNCHKAQDSVRAPSLYGVLGRTRTLQTGRTTVADENYLRDAIRKPEENLLAGYAPLMPSYREQLNEEQIHDLIAYIKSLGSAPGQTVAQRSGGTGRRTRSGGPTRGNAPRTSAGNNLP